jgi:hypothetical protein
MVKAVTGTPVAAIKIKADVGESGVEPRAYTISEFCAAHRLSQGMYFKLKRAGLGPRECKLFSKITISFEAATEWRAAREAESAV